MEEIRQTWADFKTINPNPLWDNEPATHEFEEAGYKCSMTRGGGFAWCGYLEVPYNHPWHPHAWITEWESIGPRVHGGVTLGDFTRKFLTKNEDLDPATKPHTFGFDCAHLGDVMPEMTIKSNALMLESTSVYRDMAFVIKELKAAANEAAKAMTEGSI